MHILNKIIKVEADKTYCNGPNVKNIKVTNSNKYLHEET